MTLTLGNPVTLPRTNLAWSSRRTSVAISVTAAIRRQIEGIRRATNLSLELADATVLLGLVKPDD
jgi:hypothetical protein